MADPTTRAIVGGEIVLSRNTGVNNASPTWGVVENCGDFSLEDSGTELEIKLKGNWPDAAYMRGMNKRGFSFKMLHKVGVDDVDFIAFLNAHRNRTTIMVAVSDLPMGTEGAKYVSFVAEVTKFDREDPADAESAYDVMVRPALNNGGVAPEAATEPAP